MSLDDDLNMEGDQRFESDNEQERKLDPVKPKSNKPALGLLINDDDMAFEEEKKAAAQLDGINTSPDPKKAVKPKTNSLTNKKKLKMPLMIDTENINKNFNFGGEKGDFQPQFAKEKLESDIQELASKCVAAMMRVKKAKPKSNFMKLLEDATANDDMSAEEDFDDEEENDDKSE